MRAGFTMDKYGKPRYASLRGIRSDFKGGMEGIDKRFSFFIPAVGSVKVHLFERAIDLFFYTALIWMEEMNWHRPVSRRP